MAKATLHDEFLGILDATERLARGMWSGLPRPIPLEAFKLQAIKRKERRLRLRYGPWRAKAGKRLRSAAVGGELPVYLVGRVRRGFGKGRSAEPLQLSTDVLSRLKTSRDKLTKDTRHNK